MPAPWPFHPAKTIRLKTIVAVLNAHASRSVSNGVGVAIAVNAARVKTEASLEGGAKVRATALSVEAGTAASGEQDHSFNVQSISGTGVDKIGFAGSLSIQSVENDSLATIRNGAVVQLTATTDPDLAAVSQNLKVTSRNETISQAKADASVAGGPRSGIGPQS